MLTAEEEAARIELLQAGKTDEQAAKILCISTMGYHSWRHNRGFVKVRVPGKRYGWELRKGEGA